MVVLIALVAGGGFYFYRQQMQKKKAEKEALDPDADHTEDKGDFEIPTDVPAFARHWDENAGTSGFGAAVY